MYFFPVQVSEKNRRGYIKFLLKDLAQKDGIYDFVHSFTLLSALNTLECFLCTKIRTE